MRLIVGRIPPIIFLVILPALTIMSILYLVTPNAASGIPWVIQDIMVFIWLATSIGLFYYTLIRHHYAEKYMKQGFEQAVIEFETIKKVIPIVLPISIFSGSIRADNARISDLLKALSEWYYKDKGITITKGDSLKLYNELQKALDNSEQAKNILSMLDEFILSFQDLTKPSAH
jgi:hypothetical protein